MIQSSSSSPPSVHARFERIPHSNLALRNASDMRVRSTSLLRIDDNKVDTGTRELSRVANLTTRFSIERRPVENDFAFLTGAQLGNCCAPLQQGNNLAFGLESFVSPEQCPGVDGSSTAQINAELARFLRALTLLVHCRVESRLIDREATLARNVRSEVRGK